MEQDLGMIIKVIRGILYSSSYCVNHVVFQKQKCK